MHRLISVLTVVIGLVLMIGKIIADSEPGAVPLLLVVGGAGCYFVGQARG